MPAVSVSVAIATCDRPHPLARCLLALLGGTLLPDEILIVDQGSSGETAARIKALPPAPIAIRYIPQPRHGLSASRNLALQLFACDVLAVTDDDCLPSDDWIAAISASLARHDGPAAVTGPVLPLGPEAQDQYAVSSREGMQVIDHCGQRPPWVVGTGANLAVRREWLATVGHYDVRLGVGSPGKAAEDMDYLYRLLRSGACIRYEPKALIYHERQSRARQLKSFFQYGYGMSAFCLLWMRRGDRYAVRMLANWTAGHGLGLGNAILRRQWDRACEAQAFLHGTFKGTFYGLRYSKLQ
jgi:GT2 family glycosyltransferase